MAQVPTAAGVEAPETGTPPDPIRLLLDRHAPWVTHGEPFSTQLFGSGPFPQQGWKLHVSASPESGGQVLERALPVLLAAGVRFKAVNSVGRLTRLNNGLYGASQVGKFITVYPSDDGQAVTLAAGLDEASLGLRGPRVPSDRPLRPGSLVHYRYGSFQEREPPEPGLQPFDLFDAAGRTTIDQRQQFYVAPPTGVQDPFERAGIYEEPAAVAGALGGRYLVVDVLARTYRGGVFKVIDLGAVPARVSLLKEFWHDVGPDRRGRDCRAWATNEAAILRRHAGDPRFPRFDGSFERDDNVYIALEYQEGKTLDRARALSHDSSVVLPLDELQQVAHSIAEILAQLHRAGVIYRDLKPENILITPDGTYRLIDFGLSWEAPSGSEPPIDGGTPYYCSPQQFACEAPDVRDDVFAWGAVVHELATRRLVNAPSEERQRPVRRPPLAALRPDLPQWFCTIVDRSLFWQPDERYADMEDVLAALGTTAARAGPSSAAAEPERRPSAGLRHLPNHAEDPMALAQEIGDALCESAEPRSTGVRWATQAEDASGSRYSPDLYEGTAGIALFLAELAAASGKTAYADAARGAAAWLMGPAWGHGRVLPGLHCGEAGIGFLLLRLASLLDEPGYVQAAQLRARRLVGVEYATLDLLYGAAGAAVFLTRLATTVANGGYLDRARAAGELLLHTAQSIRGESACYWEVPAIDPSLPALPYLGLAHGVAGIGLALAELAAATDDDRYLAQARGAAGLLLAKASIGEDGGWRWPRTLHDGDSDLQAQCHGATGIGQFFLRLARIDPDERYLAAARGAAVTAAAEIGKATRSGVCHGMAGHGGLLLDCYQAEGERHSLESARNCGSLLQRFRDPDACGRYRIGTDETVSPGLMLGFAGVGSFYLRLADPGQRRDLLLR